MVIMKFAVAWGLIYLHRHVRRAAEGVRDAETTSDRRSDHMQAGIGAIGYHDTTVYTKSRPKRGHRCERPGRPAG